MIYSVYSKDKVTLDELFARTSPTYHTIHDHLPFAANTNNVISNDDLEVHELVFS